MFHYLYECRFSKAKRLFWLMNMVNVELQKMGQIVWLLYLAIFLFIGVFKSKLVSVSFFVSYFGNIRVTFCFDLKISLVLSEFIKPL